MQKHFLHKVMFQIGQKVFVIKDVKAIWHKNMLLEILRVKKLLERFMIKNCKDQIEKSWKSNKIRQ